MINIIKMLLVVVCIIDCNSNNLLLSEVQGKVVDMRICQQPLIFFVFRLSMEVIVIY